MTITTRVAPLEPGTVCSSSVTPFLPELGGPEGREFPAVYLFDSMGELVEARIDHIGPRPDFDRGKVLLVLAKRMAEPGPLVYGRIFGRIENTAFCQRAIRHNFSDSFRAPQEMGQTAGGSNCGPGISWPPTSLGIAGNTIPEKPNTA